MDLETDPIVGKKVHIIVTEAEEAIKITITMVVEIVDPEIPIIMGNIRQTIGTMIDLVTEGKISIKIMVKGIETEVSVENAIDPGPGIGAPQGTQ